jgi:seryl-tRNA synthetase
MLDIKFIRENKNIIKEAVINRGSKLNVDELIKTDDKRKNLLQSVEEKRSKQNSFNAKIVKADTSEKENLLNEMKSLKASLQKEEEALKVVLEEWQNLMFEVPNIPDPSVPIGESDKENIEIKSWGKAKVFDFQIKNNIQLMEENKMVDTERGVKVAGFRGYFLRGDGVLLSFAIHRFAMDEMLKKDYELFIAPSLVRPDSFFSTGHFPKGKEDIFKTQDDLYLAGTSEVPMTGFHMNETLSKDELPKKYVSFSPCFRREIGSHGKDTKGITRVHEFLKTEQFILCEASHEESVKFHEELTLNAEDILQKLEIPYRVVLNSTGDISQGAVKTYDIESWLPSEEKYRETHSSSYYHDFQARRAGIRYKDSDNKTLFVHSLNNTAVATPRLLASIVENNQNEDGSINVPEVLRGYMGKDVIK